MFENPAQAHLALAQIEGLKQQFNALAQIHFDLRHIYLEYPDGGQPLLQLPSWMGWRCSLESIESSEPYLSSHAFYHDGAWRRLTYTGEYFTRQCAGWYVGQGISEFKNLALNTDCFLTTFPVRVPMPPAVVEIANLSRGILPDPIILPCGFHRWARILHWLAWSGSVMPTTPLCCKAEPWERCEPSLDPTLRLSSIIDNLFLRSCLALDWIAIQWGLLRVDQEEDRRISEADQPAERDRWLTVSKAASIADTSTGTISRAVDGKRLKGNGKTGRARRIDLDDLIRWKLERANRVEPCESDEHVESLMRRATRK
jgi:hypothetical protein